MIKRTGLLIFLTTYLLFAAGSAGAAEDRSLDIFSGVGAGYYYLYPKDIQVKDYYRGGMMYKGFFGFRAESGLAGVGEIGYYSEGNNSPSAPFGTSLMIVPVTASISYSLFKDSAFSPYFGAGLGIYMMKESDPDFVYMSATKFGKHIFAGADIYLDRHTVIRAELRQTFIDPVNSSLYYQANFGGLTASVSLAMEWPAYVSGRRYYSEEETVLQSRFTDDEHQAIMDRLDDIDSYYSPQAWDRTVYNPWNNPSIYMGTVYPPPAQTQEQIQKENQVQQQKREDYIKQKQQLRQEKKDSVNPQ